MPFSIEDLILKGRRGTYPDGYLDAYLAHLRRLCGVTQVKIDGALAEVAADSIELAPLPNHRF